MNKYLLLLLSLGVSQLAQAKTIYFGSEPQTLYVAYGGETVFKFSSEVKTITRANRFEIHTVDPEQPNYQILSVTPRFASGATEVLFFLNDGAVVRTNLVVIPKAVKGQSDSLYEFRPKDSYLDDPTTQTNQSTAANSEMDLMKALILEDWKSGYEIRDMNKSLDLGVKDLQCDLYRVYLGYGFKGYLFKLTNLSKTEQVEINLKKLGIGKPNKVILSSLKDQSLDVAGSGKESTILRLVASSNTFIKEMTLPVENREIKK